MILHEIKQASGERPSSCNTVSMMFVVPDLENPRLRRKPHEQHVADEFGMANSDSSKLSSALTDCRSAIPNGSEALTRDTHNFREWTLRSRSYFAILLIDEDNAWLKGGRFNVVEIRVGNDNDLVTHHREACGSAVETDNTGASRGFYHVSREARASFNIVNVDTLID